MTPSQTNMTARHFFHLATVLTVALIVQGCALIPGLRSRPETDRGERPPNFIVIFADDLGYADLGCYGAEKIATPRIDRMADEGVRFTDFYSLAPVCTPSRAALLTGCYPQRVSLPNVLHPWSTTGINTDEITIAELLRGRGYATACIGKWHLGHHPEFMPNRHGFDHYFGLPYSNNMNSKQGPHGAVLPLMRNDEVVETPAEQSTLTKRYTEEAIGFIERNRDRPFFLYFPHTFPHTPLYASDAFKDKSEGGLYGDVVEEIDWSVGQILDALKDNGLEGNTLVIFTSDNGPSLKGKSHGSAGALRSGKFSTYEGGMRVPCVMRWPGRIHPKTDCSEVAAMFDFFPTLALLAGAETPDDRIIDGKDIWPLIAGESGAKTPHDAFFYYRGQQLQAVRSGRWKFFPERTEKVKKKKGQPDEMQTVPQQLYDLEKDIGETNDVAGAHPDIVARLSELVDQCRKDIGDALPARPGKNVRPCGKVDAAPKPTEEAGRKER